MPDMSNASFKLTAEPALQNFTLDYKGVSVREVTHRALVSLAIPNDARESVEQAFLSAFKANIPAVGQSKYSEVDNTQILAMQTEQYFILFDYKDDQAVEYLKTKINDVSYLCDQSDSWVMLNVSGELSRTALERICPIDLHPESFPEGSVSRTAMEHLAVIIFHQQENNFLLMSPRSSARSFLHAITQSIENIS